LELPCTNAASASRLPPRSLLQGRTPPGSPAPHPQLRRLLSPALSAEAVSSYLPEIQDLAEKYCAAWAARGCVPALHEELKLFTFEARA
jgi:cytochrome P450